MAARTIPQRELRNNIGQILRDAEAGVVFTITVRGRPVARLGPPIEVDGPTVNVPAEKVRRLLAATPVDSQFATDVRRMRDLEAQDEQPWPDE